MNDYIARGGVVFTAEAPNWKGTLQGMQADANQFATEAMRSFDRIKGPDVAGLDRWDTMLNRVVSSLGRAVASGTQFSSSVGSRLQGLQSVYQSAGAGDRVELVQQAQQFVKNWSLPDHKAWEAEQQAAADAYRVAHATVEKQDANFLRNLSYGVTVSRDAPNAYADQHASADRYLSNQKADSDKEYYAEQSRLADQYRSSEIAKEREFYAEQQRLADAYRADMRAARVFGDGDAAEEANRRAHDRATGVPAYGRSLYDVAGPHTTSDWRSPHYGRSSLLPVGPEQDDWLNGHAGAINPIDPAGRGRHSFESDTDPFWQRTPGRWRGNPDSQANNERFLRRANFAGQQLAYGIDDAIQSYQYGGTAASIRAASNNLTAIAGTSMTGPMGVAAVVGLSAATAFASSAAQQVGPNSGWAKLGMEQWDTDPRNKLQAHNAGQYVLAGVHRQMDVMSSWLSSDPIYNKIVKDQAFNEMTRLEDREYDMKRTGFNMERNGEAELRRSKEYGQGLQTYRNRRDTQRDTEAALGMTTSERMAAENSGDQQKADKLKEQERSYERILKIQRMQTEEARKLLPELRRQADLMAASTRLHSADERKLGYDQEDFKIHDFDTFMAHKAASAEAERARIKKMNLPKDVEEDRLRALDEEMKDAAGSRDAFERNQFKANRGFRRQIEGMNSTSFDSFVRSQRNFAEDSGLEFEGDQKTAERKKLARDLKNATAEKRADVLFSQRQEWKVKPPGYNQLDENMEVYGKRLEEIEKSKELTAEERRRQMKAAKKSFDDANVKANIPSGRRNFSTSSFAKDSEEDVRYEEFYTRGQRDRDVAGKMNGPPGKEAKNGKPVDDKLADNNELLKSIDRGIRALAVVTRQA